MNQKQKKIVITEDTINRIIPPAKNREEAIEVYRQYELEYEKSKQQILEIMRKNLEMYKDM